MTLSRNIVNWIIGHRDVPPIREHLPLRDARELETADAHIHNVSAKLAAVMRQLDDQLAAADRKRGGHFSDD